MDMDMSKKETEVNPMVTVWKVKNTRPGAEPDQWRYFKTLESAEEFSQKCVAAGGKAEEFETLTFHPENDLNEIETIESIMMIDELEDHYLEDD